jgi:hypothetical protein
LDDEENEYCTDPDIFDSDGDGVGDGAEQENGRLDDCRQLIGRFLELGQLH